jgi:hypothetical protein
MMMKKSVFVTCVIIMLWRPLVNVLPTRNTAPTVAAAYELSIRTDLGIVKMGTEF